MMLYRLLDIFFVLFHSSLVVFNLFGCIWKKTRLTGLDVSSQLVDSVKLWTSVAALSLPLVLDIRDFCNRA